MKRSTSSSNSSSSTEEIVPVQTENNVFEDFDDVNIIIKHGMDYVIYDPSIHNNDYLASENIYYITEKGLTDYLAYQNIFQTINWKPSFNDIDLSDDESLIKILDKPDPIKMVDNFNDVDLKDNNLISLLDEKKLSIDSPLKDITNDLKLDVKSFVIPVWYNGRCTNWRQLPSDIGIIPVDEFNKFNKFFSASIVQNYFLIGDYMVPRHLIARPIPKYFYPLFAPLFSNYNFDLDCSTCLPCGCIQNRGKALPAEPSIARHLFVAQLTNAWMSLLNCVLADFWGLTNIYAIKTFSPKCLVSHSQFIWRSHIHPRYVFKIVNRFLKSKSPIWSITNWMDIELRKTEVRYFPTRPLLPQPKPACNFVHRFGYNIYHTKAGIVQYMLLESLNYIEDQRTAYVTKVYLRRTCKFMHQSLPYIYMWKSDNPKYPDIYDVTKAVILSRDFVRRLECWLVLKDTLDEYGKPEFSYAHHFYEFDIHCCNRNVFYNCVRLGVKLSETEVLQLFRRAAQFTSDWTDYTPILMIRSPKAYNNDLLPLPPNFYWFVITGRFQFFPSRTSAATWNSREGLLPYPMFYIYGGWYPMRKKHKFLSAMYNEVRCHYISSINDHKMNPVLL
jgi:hypothetical protein